MSKLFSNQQTQSNKPESVNKGDSIISEATYFSWRKRVIYAGWASLVFAAFLVIIILTVIIQYANDIIRSGIPGKLALIVVIVGVTYYIILNIRIIKLIYKDTKKYILISICINWLVLFGALLKNMVLVL